MCPFCCRDMHFTSCGHPENQMTHTHTHEDEKERYMYSSTVALTWLKRLEMLATNCPAPVPPTAPGRRRKRERERERERKREREQEREREKEKEKERVDKEKKKIIMSISFSLNSLHTILATLCNTNNFSTSIYAKIRMHYFLQALYKDHLLRISLAPAKCQSHSHNRCTDYKILQKCHTQTHL